MFVSGNKNLFLSTVNVVVTTVFAVMGSRPSARKLESISSSLGWLFVEVLVRLVCVRVFSAKGKGGIVAPSPVDVLVSDSTTSLEVLSIAGAELL